MDANPSQTPTSDRPAHPLAWLPNALTLARLVCAPLIALALLMGARSPTLLDWPSQPDWSELAAGLFLLAALSDLLDGVLARAFKAQSAFGAMLDPIADKALVALSLAGLASACLLPGWMILPGVLIVARDSGIVWLRARIEARGGALPVTNLAKWKTALEMLALAGLIVPPGLHRFGWLPLESLHGVYWASWLILCAAAALAVWTAILYVIAARKADRMAA